MVRLKRFSRITQNASAWLWLTSLIGLTLFAVPGSLSSALERAAQDARPASFMVMDLNDDGFDLTTASQGVLFDVDAGGQVSRTAWTKAGSDDALLTYDVNKNGLVEAGELVGSRLAVSVGSIPKSGASLLGLFFQGISLDERGRPIGALPEGAGMLDRLDPAYQLLMAWVDANHDGVAQPGEAKPLGSAGIKEIRTGFQRSSSQDAAGNILLFKGTFLREIRGVSFQRSIAEVVPAR